MKKHYFALMVMVLIASIGFGQANNSLSNLSNTSINEDLIPEDDTTFTLGDEFDQWRELWISHEMHLGDDFVFMSPRIKNSIYIHAPSLGQPINPTGLNNVCMGNNAGTELTTGAFNTIVGASAGADCTTGLKNSLFGDNAGRSIQTATFNTHLGYSSGFLNETGSSNTSVGYESMRGVSNQNHNFNSSLGARSLRVVSTGSNNTAVGYEAGFSVTTSSGQSFFGMNAGRLTTTGLNNTFIGFNSGDGNTTGIANIGLGYNSGRGLTTGNHNIAIGENTFSATTSGYENTAIGFNALQLSTGIWNTVIGSDAGSAATTAQSLVLVGNEAGNAITSGSSMTLLGYNADVTSAAITGFNSTAIGADARVSQSNCMIFGSTGVTKWGFGVTSVASTKALVVGASTVNGNGAFLTNGGTWTNTSSRAFKEDFQKLDAQDVLEKVNLLDLTKWKYKGTDEYHIGPIAEQFYDLFKVGTDDKSVSTIDPAGVALVSVQALSAKNEEIVEQVEKLTAENEALQAQISAMEECIAQMCELEKKWSVLQTRVSSLGNCNPNPSNGITNVNAFISENVKNAELRIYSQNGTLIYSQNVNARGEVRIAVDGYSFSAGIYAYSLIIDGQTLDTKQLVIAK